MVRFLSKLFAKNHEQSETGSEYYRSRTSHGRPQRTNTSMTTYFFLNIRTRYRKQLELHFLKRRSRKPATKKKRKIDSYIG